jgi:hypothetical protein
MSVKDCRATEKKTPLLLEISAAAIRIHLSRVFISKMYSSSLTVVHSDPLVTVEWTAGKECGGRRDVSPAASVVWQVVYLKKVRAAAPLR